MTLRYWLDSLVQDVTFGVRSIRQSPLVAFATVVTLTLGIGLSAGIFSLINAVWLRPPVDKDSGSFVRLYTYNSQLSFNFGQPGSISLEDYRQYETAHSLSELAAWHQVRPFFGTTNPTPLWVVLVSCNFFALYGLTKPELGRLLPEECLGEEPNSVAVISDEFWRTQLNADPKILGTIELMVILAIGTVLLSLIGIYGVVWFNVSRRTKEMGIRIALGATRHGVVYQLLRANMRPVYVGLGAGLVLTTMGSLAMQRILPLDVLNPTMYVAVSLLLQIVALEAMLGPAIRAVREDPVQALREE